MGALDDQKDHKYNELRLQWNILTFILLVNHSWYFTCTCNKVKYIEASRYEQVEVTVDFILKHPAIIVASI